MATSGASAQFAVGDFVIDTTYDDTTREFVGSVQNKPYPVRLTAPSVAEVESRFEKLLTTYLGVSTG